MVLKTNLQHYLFEKLRKEGLIKDKLQAFRKRIVLKIEISTFLAPENIKLVTVRVIQTLQ